MMNSKRLRFEYFVLNKLKFDESTTQSFVLQFTLKLQTEYFRKEFSTPRFVNFSACCFQPVFAKRK